MDNSKILKDSVTNPEKEFKFQSAGRSLTEGDLQLGNDKDAAIAENLQSTFGISKEELDGLIDGEHFNHQY